MLIPSDLAAALASAPEALHYFECLPTLQQQALVLSIEEADTRAGRRRRIQTTTRRLATVTRR